MPTTLAWGILGAGGIARTFARALPQSRTGRLVAVGSRSQAGADAFGDEFGPLRRHASYEALLADEAVQAVYLATPHPQHAHWAIRAAEAGRHVLCEKPLALNHAEAMAVVEAALEHGVFLMEAFMYRLVPQTKKLLELVREGAIGEVHLIEASYGFRADFDPESRLFANALGGGGILDVGCYPVSMARLLAGAALGRSFAEPETVTGSAVLGPSGVDEWAAATLEFPGGVLAQLSTGVRLNLENALRVFGSKGRLTVPRPWFIPAGERGLVILKPNGGEPRELWTEPTVSPYALEADAVAGYLEAGEAPEMGWEDSLGTMRALDRWRSAVGLEYEAERLEAPNPPVKGRPPRPKPGNPMRYGRLPGVDKPVSKLVMGADNQATFPHAAVMFDDFFERGGNAFDTAYIYGGGLPERLLGRWVETRRLRDEVALIGKGAHTPFCDPESLSRQLLESLDRLRTDRLDLYLMHRDNPDVPVGEFVEVLNEHKAAGRLGAFGGSNWTLERFEDANAYAAERGLEGFSVLSNNLSLARMVAPPWGGSLSVSDPASRAWLERTQTPLLAWSSQARGFFASPQPEDTDLARCWGSEDNLERLSRATALAREKGVLAVNVALAYVLAQPFPTFALIGPRGLAETRAAMPALKLELTPEELRWLNLEG